MGDNTLWAPLIRPRGRYVSTLIDENLSNFSFVQLADPQLGLLERYVEKRDPPFNWDREVALFERAIQAIRRLDPKPKFVIVCGDLVDAQPDNSDRHQQCTDLISSFASLGVDIPLLVLPGNHDVGDKPFPSDLEAYRSVWGDDYYSFWCGKCKFIVVNTQIFWNSDNCPTEATTQDVWLNNQLNDSENKTADHIIVFQHIPFFVGHVDEDDEYFNMPKKCRLNLLTRYYTAGVRYVFSGHLHRNGGGTWAPPNAPPNAPLLHVVSSSAVGVQLGNDQPGLRLVTISKNHGLNHRYYSLDFLENTG